LAVGALAVFLAAMKNGLLKIHKNGQCPREKAARRYHKKSSDVSRIHCNLPYFSVFFDITQL
jgi:hypothetical protein